MSTKPAYADRILDEIEEAGDRFESSKRARIRMIQLGREAGLTWEEIAGRLGITHSAAIGLAKRAEH